MGIFDFIKISKRKASSKSDLNRSAIKVFEITSIFDGIGRDKLRFPTRIEMGMETYHKMIEDLGKVGTTQSANASLMIEVDITNLLFVFMKRPETLNSVKQALAKDQKAPPTILVQIGFSGQAVPKKTTILSSDGQKDILDLTIADDYLYKFSIYDQQRNIIASGTYKHTIQNRSLSSKKR